MLVCTSCGYDLGGLVKGPDPVLCPECGCRTSHDSGRPLGPVSAWSALGPRKWLYVWPAGLTALVVAPVAAAFATRGADEAVIVATFAATALVWAASVSAARRDRDLHRFGRDEQRAFVVTIATLSAVGVPVVWAATTLLLALGWHILRAI